MDINTILKRTNECYGQTHMHSLDKFDADNKPADCCAALKGMKAKGFVLTQHGVLTAIEPMRDAAKEAGLKFIPGIEAYYGDEEDLMKNQHLILISVDSQGYQAISLAVSKSQNSDGLAVMNDKILNYFFSEGSLGHGHVIATTACIQGIPAAALRTNEALDKRIAKIDSTIHPVNENRMQRIEAILKDREAALVSAKEKRDACKKIAETKTSKLQKEADRGDEDAIRKLAETQEKIQRAIEVLPALKDEYDRCSKMLSEVRKEHRALLKSKEAQDAKIAERDLLKSKRLSEEALVEKARELLIRLSRIFGVGNFFVEMQYHGIEKEAKIYPVLAKLARELNLPMVAANDAHMVTNSPSELKRRQLLRAKRFGQYEELQPGDDQLYLKSDASLARWLLKILPEDVVVEALENVKTIIDRCNVEFTHSDHYPKAIVPDGMSANDAFDAAIRDGIEWRFPLGMDEEHISRLEHERTVIKTMGYADYLLIVKDFLEYGRALGPVPEDRIDEAPLDVSVLRKWTQENGWHGGFVIGPGRGSAVGSLICYLLGITNLDPLDYGLIFERFLNPERVSMPDIDSDLAKGGVRGKVIEYIKSRYGEKAVCGITTTNALAPRGAIEDASKYYALSKNPDDGTAFLGLARAMSKDIPQEVGIKFESLCYYNGEEISVYEMLMRKYGAENEDAAEILRWSRLLEGCFTVYGAHAAGIIISDNDDVSVYTPLRYNKKLGIMCTQCDMGYVESQGLLKMDLLGLKTLNVITKCLKLVEEKEGRVINPLTDIPVDDDNVYREIFQKGMTNSVFQFESSGMKSMLKRFKPTNFEDLIILVSMFRPGPLQYLDGVIEVKNGKEPEFLTKELIPILGKTYGAIVYQEQVMEIFQKLAGYTLGGSDNVRRFMSKKKMEKLKHERNSFIYGDPERGIDGCVKRGIDPSAAEKLFDQMTDFAKYCFNKSHAAAYAMNAYYTGWLKYYYPAEFLAAAMDWAPNDKIPGLMHEAKLLGVETCVPDINRAATGFTVDDGKIIFALSKVVNVGNTGGAIVQERAKGHFKSFSDFIQRTGANKRAVASLIMAGAFDSFCPNRLSMMSVIDSMKDILKKKADKEKALHDVQTLLPELEGVSTKAQLETVCERLHIATPKTKNVPTVKAYEKKAGDLAKQIALLESQYAEIFLPVSLVEDKQQRMEQEKEMLGAYVTAHPMDIYPSAEELNVPTIDAVSSDSHILYGVIANVDYKKRKKDGAPMAFLTVEDMTGEIQCSVFTKAFAVCESCIRTGNVVLIRGNAYEEDTGVVDDNGNPVVETKFMAETMESVSKSLTTYIIDVSSVALWHLNAEEEFRRRYEEDGGHPLQVHDRMMGVVRTMKYRVSDNALSEPEVKEL